jgi:MFS transporter, AAHS family, benzoate transport protein
MSTAGRVLPPKATIAVNKWLEASKFNKFHFVVFLLCLVLMTMDGYDLFVYGAAMPLLMKAFDMTPAQAGALGSAASIGTLAGALVFGPLADKVGRKKTIIACIVLCCASMGLSGLTHNAAGFGFWRFMFGVGNGGMVPNIMALASEYVPGRNRAILVAGISSGVQVGGMLGALMGMWAFPHYGWRAVFLLAALPIVLVPVYSEFLPESTTHLAKRKRLDQLRHYMSKARPYEKFTNTAVLEVDAGSEKVPLKAVFEEHRAFSTVVFWIVYGVNLYVIYGFTIWLPKLMMNHGFSLTSGLTLMLMLSISSIVGSIIAGRIADRIGARRLLGALYLIAFTSVALVGLSHNYTLLMILVSLAGAGFNGAQNVINGYIPPYYPPSMRSTAMAYNFGFGRLGGIFGPALIGLLMSMRISYEATLIALAFPSLISTAGIIAIREKYSFAHRPATAEVPNPARGA